MWRILWNVISVSRCVVCDDDTPGQECSGSSNSEGTNCLGATPYCSTRITMTEAGMKVRKGCFSEQTCISDWWFATSSNGACSQSAVTSGNVSSGSTCTFCCHEQTLEAVYCNDHLYPLSLSQFPGATATPPAASSTQHSYNTCPVCVTDTTTGQTCDETSDLDLCGDSTPFCMTSFYRQPSGYRIEKRCASRHDCLLLWRNETMTNDACVAHDLSAGSGSHLECHYCCRNPISGDLCNANLQGVMPTHLMAGGNATSSATIPTTTTTVYYTTNGVAVQDTTASDVQSTSTPHSPLKHAMACIQCTGDSTSGTHCDEANQLAVCHDPDHYCMTSFYRTATSYRVGKRCATRQDCESLWWQSTINKTDCMNLGLSPEPGSDLECHYCCFSPDPTVTFCNDDHSKVIPNYLISMGQDTRSSPGKTTATMTTTESTTLISTTATVFTTNKPSFSGTKCQVCDQDPSHRQFCMNTDIQNCKGQDELFCLNTVSFSGSAGSRISVSKSCASQSVCQSEWYDKTRLVPECLLQHPAPAGGLSELRCSYCCNSSHLSGSPCNVFDRPSKLVDFHISVPTSQSTTTTASTTPASSSTATSPATASTSASTAATEDATTTGTTSIKTSALASTAGRPLRCSVCNDLCIFFQHDVTCTTGFCMTSLTDDDLFSRVVTKSCVTEDDCYGRWWQQTSNQNLCLDLMTQSQGNSPTGNALQCHYCCHGDKCNSPDFPLQQTLYDGNKRGQYSTG